MTTIIREGRYLYTDSRYSIFAGGMRVNEDGPCKISLSRDGSCVIGMAGTYEAEIPFDLLNEAIEEAVAKLNNWPNNKTMIIGERLREFYESLDDTYNEYQIIICSPKGTFYLSTNESNVFIEMFYPPTQHFAIGSGSMFYTPFRNANIPIEDKFKIIYKSDEHSGGTINRFDIHSLVGK